MKSIFKSKTFWIAIAQGVIGVIAVLETNFPQLGWLAISKSVIDIYLRAITTQSIGVSNPQI